MKDAEEREFNFSEKPQPSPEALAAIVDLVDMIDGKGKHQTHTRQQVGRCIICSCGARAQGRLKR